VCGICGHKEPSKAGNQKFCGTCRQRAPAFQGGPKWHINNRMRVGMWASLKGKKLGQSWQALAGYSTAQLMAHLERQFLPGMTWENFGAWHIDHRRPLASYAFKSTDDPDFRAAWALTNLQPLWAVDNMRKRDRLVCLL